MISSLAGAAKPNHLYGIGMCVCECVRVCACVRACDENFPNKDASAKTQAVVGWGGLTGMVTFNAAVVVVVVVVADVVDVVDVVVEVLSNLG